MGHIRLGNLPRTRKWQEVIELIRGGADAAQVANASVRAAEKGLAGIFHDRGVVHAVWLLMRLPEAARGPRFADGLRDLGLRVGPEPGVAELAAAFSAAADASLANNRGRTDLGEMAQMAAVESLAAALGGRSPGLFDTPAASARGGLNDLGTPARFGAFARQFFGRFVHKCLDYYLSRTLADHVGGGERFPTLRRQAEFSAALRGHCLESARYVEEFAHDWLSKERWQRGGVSEERAAHFVHGAVSKLLLVLKKEAADVH
jgi:hypothetical protein